MTANLTRYIAWAERRIADVVTGERLAVGCAGVTQGPMTITYRLRLLHPNRPDLARLLALGPTIAQAVQVGAVRVIDTAGGVLIELPTPDPRTPTAADLAPQTQPGRLCLGYDAMRQPVYLDMAAHPHLLAVGPTRRGKTEAVKSALYGLARLTARRVCYVILARKRATWSAFAPAAGCLGVLHDDGDMAAALAWLAGDVLTMRTREGITAPALYIVADDLANLGDVADKVGQIASMGGGAGMHLLITTQNTGRAGGLTQRIEANLTARLVFGAADAAAAARFAGAGGSGADAVGMTPGDALLIVDGTPQRVATARADDRLIVQLPAGTTPPPWNRQNRTHPTPYGEGTPPTGGGGRPEPVTAPAPLFDLAAPPSPAECDAARAALARLGSLNKACAALYGHKNGRTWARLQEALQTPPGALESPVQPVPEMLQ